MGTRRRPRLGISACLLGRKVRFDGQHKRDPYLVETLGPLVVWVPICPEVDTGMPVPREPIRLVGRGSGVRLVAERSGTDHTEAMRAWAEQRVEELVSLELAGWVTKSGSPSCGLRSVPVWARGGGTASRDGVGLFVRALLDRLPELPIADEEELSDPAFRERFVLRVFSGS